MHIQHMGGGLLDCYAKRGVHEQQAEHRLHIKEASTASTARAHDPNNHNPPTAFIATAVVEGTFSPCSISAAYR